MTMVEKVARAIGETECKGVSVRTLVGRLANRAGIPWNEDSFSEDMRDLARAAIAAMRSPTDEMVYAGEQAINANIMGAPGPEDESSAAWTAMLDAALTES